MENVSYHVSTGNLLTIEIDLNHRAGLSKSGKTVQVASTGGAVKLTSDDGLTGRLKRKGVSLILNAYTYDGLKEFPVTDEHLMNRKLAKAARAERREAWVAAHPEEVAVLEEERYGVQAEVAVECPF